MHDLAIVVDGDRLTVTSPYHPDFPSQASALGGHWTGEIWLFDRRDEEGVRALCKRVYGTDGTAPTTTATAQLHLNAISNQQSVFFAGRLLAERRYRDHRVRLGDGVVLVAGTLPPSGGSIRHPRIDAAPGTILEIRDVPADHPDLTASYVDVVDTTLDRAALQAKRDRLAGELADLDAQIAQLP